MYIKQTTCNDWIDKWIKCKLIEQVRHGMNNNIMETTTKLIPNDYSKFQNWNSFGAQIVIFHSEWMGMKK